MIPATAIPLFKNIALLYYNESYYDLHNDYDCSSINLANSIFSLKFNETCDKSAVVLNFHNAEIIKLNVRIVQDPDSVTIDSIYRGRFDNSGTLVDNDTLGRGYFYIEFYNEASIELWADAISLVDI